MQKEDFYSTKSIESKITNRKSDVHGNKVNWLTFRIIRIEKEHPFSIFTKTTFSEDEPYHEINLGKKLRGRPLQKFQPSLEILYPNGKEISVKKLKDIKQLMSFVPLDAREFYNLEAVGEFEDDVEGYGDQVDFDIEQD